MLRRILRWLLESLAETGQDYYMGYTYGYDPTVIERERKRALKEQYGPVDSSRDGESQWISR